MSRSKASQFKPAPLGSGGPFPNPTVVEQTYGVCTEVGTNNNKFYRARLERSSNGKWRCHTAYARVGYTAKEEERGYGAEYEARAAYEAVCRDKYETFGGKYTPVDILDHDGSAPVAQADSSGTALVVATGKGVVRSVGANGLQKGGRGVSAPSTWPQAAQAFYNKLLRETTVLIETGMQASAISAAGFMTPLGLVGDSALAEGQAVLQELADAIARGRRAEIERLNSQFFRRIPTASGMKLSAAVMDDAAKVATKAALLDSARGLIAAQAGSASGQTSAPEYPVALDLVTAEEEKELTALLRKETCRCHGADIKRLKPRSAFRVTRDKDIARFRDTVKRLGQDTVLTLFHGTRRTSAAGILSRGFLSTQAAVASGGSYAGSAFGDGCYFAANSGKSLGYTGGAAPGERILFVALVCMGKAQEHTGRAWGGFHRKPGYDSVWAKGGLDLVHDEMIVGPEQTAIAYALEV